MAKAELIKARELIETGWLKGRLYGKIDNVDCYCLDGALAAAHGIDVVNPTVAGGGGVYNIMDEHDGVVQDAKTIIISMASDDQSRFMFAGGEKVDLVTVLWRFNDYSFNTKGDVIELLDRAISSASD